MSKYFEESIDWLKDSQSITAKIRFYKNEKKYEVLVYVNETYINTQTLDNEQSLHDFCVGFGAALVCVGYNRLT